MKNRPNTKYQHDNDFWNDKENQSENSEVLNDKHYHKLVYQVEPFFNEKRNKWMKHKTTKFYSSGDTGSYIRDAATGYYYNVKVGSKEEDHFFKVRMCHTKFDFPVTVFYNSPGEFEREHYTTLLPSTIQAWHKKQLTLK
jgi:hypothetical protein